MKQMNRLWLLLSAAALLGIERGCFGFLTSIRTVHHFSLASSTSNNSGIEEVSSSLFEDEFADLVESHPLDDVEPPERQARCSPCPQEEWKRFYSMLKERNKEQPGDEESSVVHNIMEESLFRHWTTQQRKAFMKTLGVLDLNDKANVGTPFLSRKQKELLDQVNFPWGHLQTASLTNDIVYSSEFQRRVRLGYKDYMWNGWYEQLGRFVLENGHSRVPMESEEVELAKWVAQQVELRWDMPARRRRRLDELQFDWDWKGGKDDSEMVSSRDSKEQEESGYPQKASFGRRVKELKQYRIDHGDCDVPLEHPGGLGKWVERMRERRSKLTPRSIQKLETIGVVFIEKKQD